MNQLFIFYTTIDHLWKQLSIIENNLVDQFEYVHSQKKMINSFIIENNETKVTEVYNIFKIEFIDRSKYKLLTLNYIIK